MKIVADNDFKGTFRGIGVGMELEELKNQNPDLYYDSDGVLR